MNNKTLGIIGFGNMGRAIQDGLLKNKLISKERLLTSNKQGNNKEVASKSNILILAVKPQIIKNILEELRDIASSDKLIISIVAGAEINSLEKILGTNKRIIRVMPNLCAKVNQSISCWVKNKNINFEDVKNFKKIFKSIGKEIELKDENLIDQITAISGSGPAYFFYFTELLEKAAIDIGLDKNIAKILAKHTLIGSAETAKCSNNSILELRTAVTSKGGTTEAAFKIINNSKFNDIFFSAVKTAYEKSVQLHLKV